MYRRTFALPTRYVEIVDDVLQLKFNTPSQRIIDYMPLTIEHSLNRTLDSALQNKLLNDLIREANFSEKAEKLLTESEDIAEKRQALSEQKERLLQIRGRLLDVVIEDEDDWINGALTTPDQVPPSPHSTATSAQSIWP